MAEREERICIPFTHTYDQFTTFFYDGRVYLSDTSYPIGQCCVDIVNMDEEVLEPPAFWSVGCLPRKIASFLLEFGAFRRGSFGKVSVVSNQPCSFHSYSGSKVGQILNILHDIKHRKPDTSKPCEGLGYLIDSGASYV